MTSAPVLDLDALVKPIPGDNPVGKPLADVVRMELDTLRREAVPGDPTTSHWKADWSKVLRVTTETLTTTGKDLHAAARLVEAATKIHGLPGLRDGLRLLQRLVAECWDNLHPMPEDGDTTDVRESPIIWLNDVGRGARFPQTIAVLPLFKVAGNSFGPHDARAKDTKQAFDEAVANAKPKDLQALRTTHADLLAARQALANLSTALTARRVDADNAPDYTSPETPGNLGSTLERCVEMIEDISKKRNFPLTESTAAPDAATASVEKPADTSVPEQSAGETREGLYQKIEQIASALRRLEPHSPIPFLLERCVKLGALPFPELMRAMVRETGPLDELDRLLGIETKK